MVESSLVVPVPPLSEEESLTDYILSQANAGQEILAPKKLGIQ
jgi:hypothetical protein